MALALHGHSLNGLALVGEGLALLSWVAIALLATLATLATLAALASLASLATLPAVHGALGVEAGLGVAHGEVLARGGAGGTASSAAGGRLGALTLGLVGVLPSRGFVFVVRWGHLS